MKALKAFFLSCMLREKILILVFLGLAVAVWGSSFLKRSRNFNEVYQRVGTELKEQTLWLSRRPQIEASVQKAIGRLDPNRTLDGNKLVAEVNRIAALAGLPSNVQVDDLHKEPGSLYTVHTLRFSVSKVDYQTLVRFYLELQKHSPYIGLEQFVLKSDTSNPANLNATLRISSVEVQRKS